MSEAEVKKLVQEEIAKLFDLTGTGDKPASWAKAACENGKEKGLFSGDGKGNYGWQKPITREQVAVLLDKLD